MGLCMIIHTLYMTPCDIDFPTFGTTWLDLSKPDDGCIDMFYDIF